MRSYICTLIFIFLGINCCGISHADSLWQQLASQTTNIERVHLLLQLAELDLYTADKKDSINGLAINEAKASGNNELMMQAYRSYFRNNELSNTDIAAVYAGQMLELAKSNNNNEWYYEAYTAYAKIKLAAYQPVAALDHAGRAYYHVTLLTDDTLKAECMMLYGNCQEQSNQKIEAFRNYINALYLAEKHNNKALILSAFENLSTFYQMIGNFERAKDYKQKQIKLILSDNPVDSITLMNSYSYLAGIFFNNNERSEAEDLTQKILAYAYRKDDIVLLDVTFRAYRSYLIDNNYLKDLINVYTKEYPQELYRLQQNDTTYYYRIMAYVTEIKGSMDSAVYYYKKAETGTLNEKYQNTFLSNFYKRYAQFLLRKKDVPAAIAKMEQAFEYAKQSQYLPYLVETTNYLDSLNYIQGNVAKAYEYNKLNKEYEQQQNDVNKGDEILRMEIDNENKQLALNKEREEEQTRRQHQLQYMGISLLLGFSLVLLVMLGVMKVHRLLIKSVGFFSFIFLFEFIVLLADNWIHDATHGEPWKVLSIKIVLIGILFPLHHWAEEKAINYLTTHNFINTAKLKMKFMRVKKPVIKEKAEENIQK
jgi:hypothetical protein